MIGHPQPGDHVLLVSGEKAQRHPWIMFEMRNYLGTVQTVCKADDMAFHIEADPRWAWSCKKDIEAFVDEDETEFVHVQETDIDSLLGL